MDKQDLIWGPLVAQMMKNPPAVQETWVQSLGCKDPLEKEMAIYSSILGASLVAQMVKISSAMQETQVQSLEIPWRRNGYPLQYSCLQNPMDRGAYWATVHGVAQNQTRQRWLILKETTRKFTMWYWMELQRESISVQDMMGTVDETGIWTID